MIPTSEHNPGSLSRRDALRMIGGAGVAVLAAAGTSRVGAEPVAKQSTVQPFVLPPLGFAFGALEPHLDARTMEIHHGRHHKAYVDNANRALQDHPGLKTRTGESLMEDLAGLPETVRTAVRNNVGGHLNHSLFWALLTPGGAQSPGPELTAAIRASFGSLEGLRDQFNDAALKRFGSGWAWLVYQGGQLRILTTPNQDSPLSERAFPVIGLDVWEHAYYLAYQNRRGDYAKAFWNVLNWTAVDHRYALARS